VVVGDEPDAGLGERQRAAAPVGVGLAADGGDGAEGGVSGVEELLAGGERGALGVEGLGGLGALVGGERLLGAHPGPGESNGGHRGAEPLGGSGRRRHEGRGRGFGPVEERGHRCLRG
jgi:hypothetical protein